MTDSLKELKDKLYKAFDEALAKAESYNTSTESRARFYAASAKLAGSIVKTEERLDARKAQADSVKSAALPKPLKHPSDKTTM